MILDPVLHEYWTDDRSTRIRSMSRVLKDAGLVDDRWFTAESRERGTAVHKLCQRYAKGERYDDLGRELKSLEYVNSLSGWFAAKGVYAIATEQIISGYVNGRPYAGTFDLLAIIKGKRWLIDYKTGAGLGWHKAQISAYAMGWIDDKPVNPYGCIMLHLKPDGRYRDVIITGRGLLDGLDMFKDAISMEPEPHAK